MFDNCLTKELKLEVNRQILIYLPMKEKNVTVREFLRNFKTLASKKIVLIVQKNGKPEGVFVPYERWEKKQKKAKKPKSLSGISLAEAIEKYMVEGGDPYLSEKVDVICYGAPNPYRNDND